MSSNEIIQSLLQAKLKLQDENLLEHFWFVEGNQVVATLGIRGGAICGPVLNYHVRDDESVVIGDRDEYRWEQLKLSADEQELIVICGGMAKRFTITRPPKRERWLP